HVTGLVALRFRQQHMREVGAEVFLRAPGDEAFGVHAARQMGVKIAALGHAAQEGAQRGVVVARRFEGGAGGDGIGIARDPGDAQTDDHGQEEDDGTKDRAPQGPPRSLQDRSGIARSRTRYRISIGSGRAYTVRSPAPRYRSPAGPTFS